MSSFTERISGIFSNEGLLSEYPEFEFRREQQEMAAAIAQSLESSSHIIIEAPTGIGKTFAYLVPSIIYAKENKRKALISTRTINLQEQIIKKDIPALKKLLKEDFSAVIMKGRANYICTRRLNQALLKKNSLFSSPEQDLLEEIYHNVQKNDKGELQEMDIDQNSSVFRDVWNQIYAEQFICTSKSCGAEDTICFFQRAKQKMKDAEILILNHSLFFTLFGMMERNSQGYIFGNDFLILDEAHMIESIAAENISEQVSKETVKYWLNRLYNPKKEKGFYKDKNAYHIIRLIPHLLKDTDYFFNELAAVIQNKYEGKRHKSEIRVLEPVRIDYSYIKALDELLGEIKRSVSTAKNSDEENEIKNFSLKLMVLKNSIINFTEQKYEEHVYWLELSKGFRKNITINISPINLADYFRENIFNEKRQAILTSATLSINNSLQYFQSSIGAESVKTMLLDTPFNYENQMKLYISRNVPSPKSTRADKLDETFSGNDYDKILNETILKYIKKTEGGVLVLFTNFSSMNKSSLYLKEKLSDAGINIFTQGEKYSSHKLLKMFREDENSILLGVDTFWMGVDVPGVSLRCVIITKLPFDIPDNPIIEAKLEAIEKRGGNPFYEFSLPSAILKFKQGIGRLIRNKTDEGIAVVLDSRILTSSYGVHFLSALPNQNYIIDDDDTDG